MEGPEAQVMDRGRGRVTREPIAPDVDSPVLRDMISGEMKKRIIGGTNDEIHDFLALKTTQNEILTSVMSASGECRICADQEAVGGYPCGTRHHKDSDMCVSCVESCPECPYCRAGRKGVLSLPHSRDWELLFQLALDQEGSDADTLMGSMHERWQTADLTVESQKSMCTQALQGKGTLLKHYAEALAGLSESEPDMNHTARASDGLLSAGLEREAGALPGTPATSATLPGAALDSLRLTRASTQ